MLSSRHPVPCSSRQLLSPPSQGRSCCLPGAALCQDSHFRVPEAQRICMLLFNPPVYGQHGKAGPLQPVSQVCPEEALPTRRDTKPPSLGTPGDVLSEEAASPEHPPLAYPQRCRDRTPEHAGSGAARAPSAA